MNSVNGPFNRCAARPWAALLALFVGVVSAEAADRALVLEVIHQLENPRNLTRPGRYGELGPYQFRAATWRMHTNLPFRRALDRSISDQIAIKHYEWLKRGLERARMPATPYNIALAWNGGLSAAITGKAPRRAHDYAQRAANLVAILGQPQQLLAEAQ